MLQEVIDLQTNAVNALIEKISIQDEITFKAPTGSGKTFMMADFMNQMISKNNNIIFLVSTLSKGNLAEQNYEKFCEYSVKNSFSNLNPYLISSEISGEERLFIPTEYNVFLLPRDLYKKGGRLMQGAMEAFLMNMTLTKSFGGKEKEIYLIKDECHIATNNLDNLSESFFKKIINISATPNLKRGQTPDVEITDEDAVQTKLIKHIELGDEEDSVEDAINKFEEIKKDYRNLLGVNPCLIIQISNKDKADEELNNTIFPILNKAEHQDLKWMLIVDDDKKCDTNDIMKAKNLPVSKWKDYAKDNTAGIDIIIFKMVISEGWDIPRACMLYQMRDSKSTQLDEQVMGRVRRNPRLLDFETLSPQAQKLATTAWIWGIIPKDKKKIYSVKLWDESKYITSELKIKTTILKNINKKDNFNLIEFLSKKEKSATSRSIFDLFKKFRTIDNSIKTLAYEYLDSYSKWWLINENIDEIIAEQKKYICDYNQSMDITKDENGQIIEYSLPIHSNYFDNGNYININDWIWKRNDGKEKFSFDSYAEAEWADVLKNLSTLDNFDTPPQRAVKRIIVGKRNPKAGIIDLFGNIEPEKINSSQKYLWGKNYIPNSDIKFEYYLNGIHASYPDFIMKDSYNRIHIFEVKSVNLSNNLPLGFDKKSYENKINEIKKCYQYASKITNQIFYLPVLKEDVWQITMLKDGNIETITKDQFINFVLRK